MKDAMKQLLESELLNVETKLVLQEAWDTALAAKEAEIEANYAEKLDEEKSAMTAICVEMVNEAVAEELSAIAEEIKEARSLEVTYAEKLETFKEQYDEKLQEQMKVLVAEAVAEEVEELKEDIDFAKKHHFAMSMFESFQEVYAKTFGGSDLNAYDELQEAKKELDALKRDKALDELLEGIEGSKRNIALTILEGVSTENLEARFESLRPILLKESKTEEKDETVTESSKEDGEVSGKVVIEEGIENEADIEKNDVADAVSKRLARSLKMAGL